jgi:hypothetical protein
MRTVAMPIFLLGALCVSAQSPPAQRFEGSATLRAAPPSSSDGRFALSAELHATAPAAATGRFAIDATLKPDGNAKALFTACGAATTDIFSNGFEN